MIAFWILVALMMLLALAFVLLPLTRPISVHRLSAQGASVLIHRQRLLELDEAHAQGTLSAGQLREAQDEIALQVLADTGEVATTKDPHPAPSDADQKAILGAAFLIPTLAVLLYLWLGDVGALNQVALQAPPAHSGMAATDAHSVTEMVTRLEARLLASPEDAEGWMLLARSRGYLKQFDKAESAYARALALLPDDIRVMTDLTEAHMLANGHRLDAKAQALLEKVLAQEPEHPKAQFLLGMQRAPKAPAGATPVIRARVALAPSLAANPPPDAVVFVFVRAAQGPRMPLAIVRRQARDLPFEVELSDAQSMSPDRPLSGQSQFIVGARLSRSGNAMPAKGDLEGLTGVLHFPLDKTVNLEIDHVLP